MSAIPELGVWWCGHDYGAAYISRACAKESTMTGFVIVSPVRSGGVELIGDDMGNPYRTLIKAEAALFSRSCYASEDYILMVQPWLPLLNKQKEATQ